MGREGSSGSLPVHQKALLLAVYHVSTSEVKGISCSRPLWGGVLLLRHACVDAIYLESFKGANHCYV